MKIRSLVAAANIGFMFLLVVGIEAEATELKVLSSIGLQTVLLGCFGFRAGPKNLQRKSRLKNQGGLG